MNVSETTTTSMPQIKDSVSVESNNTEMSIETKLYAKSFISVAYLLSEIKYGTQNIRFFIEVRSLSCFLQMRVSVKMFGVYSGMALGNL